MKYICIKTAKTSAFLILHEIYDIYEVDFILPPELKGMNIVRNKTYKASPISINTYTITLTEQDLTEYFETLQEHRLKKIKKLLE